MGRQGQGRFDLLFGPYDASDAGALAFPSFALKEYLQLLEDSLRFESPQGGAAKASLFGRPVPDTQAAGPETVYLSMIKS